MAALVAAIHVFLGPKNKAWMAGSIPAMTIDRRCWSRRPNRIHRSPSGSPGRDAELELAGLHLLRLENDVLSFLDLQDHRAVDLILAVRSEFDGPIEGV